MPDTRISDLTVLTAPAAGDLIPIVDISDTTMAASGTTKRVAQSVLLASVQPLDATLTALAGLTIAADSLAIGTGADAFTQTTFAANTLPARASTGSLVAKPITDFGLSLIDDAADSNARTTLGLGTIATQAASSVAITGGAINGATVGATTTATGAFTSLSSTIGANFATSSGNVGIGTASPGASLDVYTAIGASRTTPLLKLYGLGGATSPESYDFVNWGSDYGPSSGGLRVTTAGSVWGSQIYSSSALSFNGNGYSNAAPAVLINSLGNMGIGTASPGARIQVSSGAAGTIGEIIKGATSQTANLTEWQNSSATVLACVTAAGNVGIGTAGPARKLTVFDELDITNGQIRFGYNNLYYWEVGRESTTTGRLMIVNKSNNTPTELLSILTSGNVGIGTSSPNANAILDVTSTSKAFMPPRMTTTQKNAIASPTSGMVVYDSTLNKLSLYGASAWQTVTSV